MPEVCPCLTDLTPGPDRIYFTIYSLKENQSYINPWICFPPSQRKTRVTSSHPLWRPKGRQWSPSRLLNLSSILLRALTADCYGHKKNGREREAKRNLSPSPCVFELLWECKNASAHTQISVMLCASNHLSDTIRGRWAGFTPKEQEWIHPITAHSLSGPWAARWWRSTTRLWVEMDTQCTDTH